MGTSIEPSDPRSRVRAYMDSVILEDMTRATREQEKQQREAEQKQQEDFQRCAQYIKNDFEMSPHYADDDYLREYARLNTGKVLAQRDYIRSDYNMFIAWTEKIEWLKENESELYHFRLWRVRMLRYAEEYAIAPQTEPPKKEKKRPTRAKVRKRMERRLRAKNDDDTAMAFVAFEGMEGVRDAQSQWKAELWAREDLSVEEKAERSSDIDTITDQRVAEITGGTSNGSRPQSDPPEPYILGQD